MTSKSKKNIISFVLISAVLAGVIFISGCSSVNSFGSIMAGAVYKSDQGIHESFPNDKYELYISNISGTAYGWKFLCFLPIATPDTGKAIEEIWKKADIPLVDRKNKTIINITERWGTYWSCIIIGQNYVTVTGDIVELKDNKK